MGLAGEAGLSGIGPAAAFHFRGEAHEGWSARPSGSLQFRHRRAEGRPTACRLLGYGPTGEALEGGVAAFRPDQGADGGEPIHALSDPRQVFADLHAGEVRGDRLEFAADFRRRVHFQVDHVLVGRATRQEDHDDRLLGIGPTGRLLGRQQLRERQAAEEHAANSQE